MKPIKSQWIILTPKSPYSVYKVMLKVNQAAQDPEQNDSQLAHKKVLRCCTWTILQSFLWNEDIMYQCSTSCFSCLFFVCLFVSSNKTNCTQKTRQTRKKEMLYYITPFKYSKPMTEDNPQYFYWNTIHTFFIIFLYILFSFLHKEEVFETQWNGQWPSPESH